MLNHLNWRYAVKKFDPSQKIAPELWETIEASLVLTPSSFGLQPWKFLVVRSPEIKSQLAAASWNQSQPADCSHLVVFAALQHVDEAYVDRFLNRVASTRGVDVSTLSMYRQVVLGFLQNNLHRHANWATNQVYIALGQLLTVAATLNVDACPMEGIVPAEYDRILGLENSDYKVSVACALGYRHPEDKYALAKKVRFELDQVIQYL